MTRRGGAFIPRCENASTPSPIQGKAFGEMSGREVDALVAGHVMGWKMGKRKQGGYVTRADIPTWLDGSKRAPFDVDQWSPSTMIELAWLVVERMQERHWHASFLHRVGPPDYVGFAWEVEFRDCAIGSVSPNALHAHESAPMAICLAALQALGVPAPQENK